MTVIDTYLKTLSEPEAAELERMRDIVHEIVPDATEVISYGMPGFRYHGKYMLGFNAFKDHLSLFPTGGPVEKFKNKLGDFKLSKGTIQFTVVKPIPDLLLKQIVQERIREIDEK